MTGACRWFARAVLIDLDGTLLDTAPDLAAAINRALAELGRPALPTSEIATFVGKGVDVLVQRALARSFEGAADVDLFASAKAAFARHYREQNGRATQIFPGVESALKQFRDNGLKLACVTNKPREFTQQLLVRFGMVDQFDAAISGDDTVQKKPHPAPLLAACERLGVDPADAVMVGDSENDLHSARAAGCRIVLVEGGYNEGRPIAGLPADAIVAALADAADLITVAGEHPANR